MKHTLFIFSFIFIGLSVSSAAQAMTASKFMSYIFDPGPKDYDRPYMTEWENAYDSSWEDPYWSPTEWAHDAQTAQVIINNFYHSGVLNDQYVDDGTPIIKVGQTFLELSSRDQRRVVRFIAHAFDIDGLTGNGVMHIVLWNTRHETPLGIYSRGMVQLH